MTGFVNRPRRSAVAALVHLLPILSFALLSGAPAEASELSDHEAMAREIFAELIEINTTQSVGDNTAAAQAMADRLLAAGYPPADVKVLVPAPGKGNLVARLRSPAPTRPPLLVLAHIDVVEANPEDWSVPPFEFLEKDGYFYGRGTSDDKDEAAIYTAIMIKLKKEGYRPDRDIIMALTADEEGGPVNGVEYLLAEHRDLVDAAFVLNEGGGGAMQNGEHLANMVQAAEKVYQSYHLEATNSGGHSSLPRADNAIYQLAAALLKISEYQFDVEFNEVTRAFFSQGAATLPAEQQQMAKGLLDNPPDPQSVAYFSKMPAFNSRLRTTCVATELAGGHAENALPQRAGATVNCRIMPGVDPAIIQQTLAEVIGDPGISITPLLAPKPSPASPLTEEVMAPIMEVTEAMWPGVAVVPTMSTGATDGLFFRNAGIPVYGVSGVFSDMDDNRAHGRDERLAVASFYDALDFLERLVRAYTSD